MATRKKPINKNYLILLGVGAAAVGTWLIAGDAIKKLIKGEKPEMPALEPSMNVTPAATGSSGSKPTINKEVDTTGDVYDIREKLKPGSKGSAVGRVQLIINEIANIRGDRGFTANNGQKITFPIQQDRDFGNKTNLGALYSFPSYKENGFITLYNARLRWCYIKGYYNRSFPSALADTINYNDYQSAYKSGQIDRAKNEGK
jgi:hypothetical protein